MTENRLAAEQSPYLLQHRHNPVDWYPWGEEAFARAQAEDRPVFLSIGYATCHWCHVMERESFEDEEVAARLNEGFVSIKVDREERPDIDGIYMAACQTMSGAGGWPLTIIMTPDRRPFFAGTYFPKETRFGRIGLLEVLEKIRALWTGDREQIEGIANELTGLLREPAAGEDLPFSLGAETLARAYRELLARYDAENGGFGRQPKFPTPHNLLFLLRFAVRSADERPLTMVTTTLDAMRRGGIFDQVGFGFHRYSTDAKWLVPHFEKMLYDQALLLTAYAEAFRVTGEEAFRQMARDIITYLLRDMQAPEGGFFSAEDADSEGEEGRFYVWTQAEMQSVLEPTLVSIAEAAFGVAEQGNFEEEASGKRNGANVLHRPVPIGALAHDFGLTEKEVKERLETARKLLFEARSARIRPLLDDKILTDWNGLTIAALARAARILDEPDALLAAKRAARFVLDHLQNADGRLLHRYREGSAGINGFLDDYSFFICGLLELHDATLDSAWLREAEGLCHVLIDLFSAEDGAFYLAPGGTSDLLVRQKEFYDGALPSGNAVALSVLLRLARLTSNSIWEDHAARLLTAASPQACRTPSAHTALLLGLDLAISPSREIVLVGSPGRPETEALLRTIRAHERPGDVLLFKDPSSASLDDLAPFTRDMKSVDNQPAVYLCQNHACLRPVTEPVELAALLSR